MLEKESEIEAGLIQGLWNFKMKHLNLSKILMVILSI